MQIDLSGLILILRKYSTWARSIEWRSYQCGFLALKFPRNTNGNVISTFSCWHFDNFWRDLIHHSKSLFFSLSLTLFRMYHVYYYNIIRESIQHIGNTSIEIAFQKKIEKNRKKSALIWVFAFEIMGSVSL